MSIQFLGNDYYGFIIICWDSNIRGFSGWTDPKNQIPTIHLCLLLIKKILLKSKKSNSIETDVYRKTTKLNANEKLIKP